MNPIADWIGRYVTADASAPLFTARDLVVETFVKGSLRKLRRHPDFDALMIATVEAGLARQDWQGLVYVMYWPRPVGPLPLYIGKAERKGTRHALSHNLANIRRNQQAFGRWGYGLAYHLGDLSHAMFGGAAYKAPTRKYRLWAERLFASINPPILREPVHVALIGWHAGMRGPSGLVSSVATVEMELIALAGAAYPDELLNTDGR